MGGDIAVLRVASPPRTEQNHRHEADPASDRMNDYRSGEIVELRAESAFQPGLHAEVLVPCDALEERIHERHQQHRRGQLRIKAGAFGNPARHDRRDCRSEGQQEEEFHQVIAIPLGEFFGPDKKADPIRNAVTDAEIGDCGHREIGEDFHQGVHLVLGTHRAKFQKSKTRVHREHHDCTEQYEQSVRTAF